MLDLFVGATGFEPATSTSRTWRPDIFKQLPKVRYKNNQFLLSSILIIEVPIEAKDEKT